MATKLYKTRIVIELDFVGRPSYDIKLNGVIVDNNIVADLPAGTHTLEIEHRDKHPHDVDTAVIISSIAFNDIVSKRFVWAGIYIPDYPQPWASQQKDLAATITNTNYLGWNGVWRLEFTAPVFTWIHRLENLGWIYD